MRAMMVYTVGIVCLFMPYAVKADEQQQLAIQLVREQGSVAEVQKALQMQLQQMEVQFPGVPQSSWNETAKKIGSNELESRLAAVYAEAYSEAELKAILAFFKSKAGKAYLKKQPLLQPRAGAVAGLFGLEIYSGLQKKHPNLLPPNTEDEARMKSLFEMIQKKPDRK